MDIMPEIYFFDMDHTLINNDCDVSWKQFLVEAGIAPSNALDLADYYFEEYLNDRLDFNEFLDFQLAEFKGKSLQEMEALADEHFERYVKEKFYQQILPHVDEALKSGKPVSLLTSTNNIIAGPVAKYLGIPYVCASELEIVNGVFTGKVLGEYCLGEGKIAVARELATKCDTTLDKAKYYGDSISDRFILGAVGYPVAVNPGEELKALSQCNRWEILDILD